MHYKISISVIMTCCNSEKFIKNAIESILSQSFYDWELIIIDDGSTDHTSHIISGFTDNRIKFIRLPINKGTYPARNLGMKLAKGKYIALMDSDDISLSHRFQVQYEYLESHKNVACVGSSFELINDKGLKIGIVSRPIDYQEIKVLLLKDNYITNIMFRSSLVRLKQLQFNVKYIFSSDYDFHCKISQDYKIVNINEILFRYRIHGHQISSSKKIMQIQFADQIRLTQLRNFNIPISQEEKEIHLKLMKGMHISEYEIQKCEKWLNKLLEANHFNGLYSDKYLYAFLQNAISFAINNQQIKMKA